MYKIRDAKTSDNVQVCNVLRRSILEVCASDYNEKSVIDDWLSNKTEDNVSQWIESDSTYSVVCINKYDDILGFGLASLKGEILLMYLVPEALFKGNGKLMLERIEKRLSNEGISEIYTISSITAKAFYERNGFIKNGDPQLVGTIKGDFPLLKRIAPSKPLKPDTPR
ncbi:MAG: GNAT family N-acetyltransferase [Gammaproteobacteria bacterium]|nr:GNAT family N-acetyltransferase [Gammaproteobacteria bacterium]MBT8132913.1 GNAT family N-acetyltransferase [Gammaproteobacteria bacterium]NNJ49846.1 GNAT family N-acetyltransferase [Gammaproteobacteria bacterium]